MYNWVHMLIWPITAMVLSRTVLRAVGVVVLYLNPEEKADNNG